MYAGQRRRWRGCLQYGRPHPVGRGPRGQGKPAGNHRSHHPSAGCSKPRPPLRHAARGPLTGQALPAMERAMRVQEVILRAMAKRITWWQAAEIIGISDRHMRRWRERYEEFGYDGLFDRRRGKPSPKRVPLALVEQILGLYREKYFDL